MRIVRLNNKTKTLITKLLNIQARAIECDNVQVLTKINIILFNINERWRVAMLKANPRNFEDYQLIERLNNATCYKF